VAPSAAASAGRRSSHAASGEDAGGEVERKGAGKAGTCEKAARREVGREGDEAQAARVGRTGRGKNRRETAVAGGR